MLKRSLAILVSGILAAAVIFKGGQLVLYSYVLTPFLVFPVLNLCDRKGAFVFLSIGILVFVLVYSGVHHPMREMVWLGLELIGLIALYLFYRMQWGRNLQLETSRVELAARDLETLQHKHQLRLESLHHLEKQVAGLLDLFEIARDFTECLSFDGLAEIMHKRVLPELAFKKMRLVLIDKSADNPQPPRAFSVDREGIKKIEDPLSEEEVQETEDVSLSRQLLQKTDTWVFPLVTEGDEMAASLTIEGAESEDLAKFEVLAAYLTLQVKKIRLYEAVKDRSIKDGLTGVFVRRHFLERFEEELKRSLKYQLPLAVLMLDIDLFKRYNDEHGHLAGDAALREVASVLKQNLRKVDLVARYGGEEFVAVIPETRREGAMEAAERIRSNIARHPFKVFDQETKVTVSIGVASFSEEDVEGLNQLSAAGLTFELIRQADKALYRAKEEGRNRVVLYQDIR